MNWIKQYLISLYFKFENYFLELRTSSIDLKHSLNLSSGLIQSARSYVCGFFLVNYSKYVLSGLTRSQRNRFNGILKFKPKFMTEAQIFSLSEQELMSMVYKIENFISRYNAFSRAVRLKHSTKNLYNFKIEVYNHSYYSLVWDKLSYLFVGLKMVFIFFLVSIVYLSIDLNFILYADSVDTTSLLLKEIPLTTADMIRLYDTNSELYTQIINDGSFYNNTWSGLDTETLIQLRNVAESMRQIPVSEHYNLFLSLYSQLQLTNEVFSGFGGCFNDLIQSTLLSSVSLDIDDFILHYYQPTFVIDEKFFSVLIDTNLYSSVTGSFNREELLKWLLNDVNSIVLIKKLHSLGYYTNLGEFALAPTSQIIDFINLNLNEFSASQLLNNVDLVTSINKALSELCYRYINMKFILNQLSVITSSSVQNDSILFSELQSHLNNMYIKQGNFIGSSNLTLVIIGSLLVLLLLISIYLYIPLSSIISKVFSGLVIFLGSAGFVFLLIPDYSFFGLLIVIVYCSAIAILLIIAFFLLHSKFGLNLENGIIKNIIFYSIIFIYVFYTFYLFSYWVSIEMYNPTYEMIYSFIFYNLGLNIYNKLNYLNLNASFVFSYNWYSHYGFLVDLFENSSSSSWLESMTILSMDSFINFLQLNNFDLYQIAINNFDSVSIFQRLSLSLYGQSYAFIIVVLGILLLIIFIILVALLRHQYNK